MDRSWKMHSKYSAKPIRLKNWVHILIANDSNVAMRTAAFQLLHNMSYGKIFQHLTQDETLVTVNNDRKSAC